LTSWQRLPLGRAPSVVMSNRARSRWPGCCGLGAAKGQTVRDVVAISPEELKKEFYKQVYVVGHELAHVLQFEAIGSPGSGADERWHLMEERYAAEASAYGRREQYDIPPNLTFRGLDVVDRRFTLESIAACVGQESSGHYLDRVGGSSR
jgi:hypothetical protein